MSPGEMASLLFQFVIAALFGGVGGYANYLIDEKNEERPGTVFPISQKAYGNILLGAIAGVVIWGLGATDLELKRLIAMCIVSGMGGGSLLESIVERMRLSRERQNLTEEGIKDEIANLKAAVATYRNVYQAKVDSSPKDSGADNIPHPA